MNNMFKQLRQATRKYKKKVKSKTCVSDFMPRIELMLRNEENQMK